MKLLLRFIEKHWLILTLIIMASITLLSLYPLKHLPEVPGSDKTHHFIAYAALAFPIGLARPKNWIFIVFGFFCYSGLIELVQPYVNRYGEWLDLAANTMGLIIGIALAFILRRSYKKDRH